jgi:DNA-binding SARP family transcriptional activator
LPTERAAAAADRLSDHRILHRGQPLAFRHGLVAAAVVRFLAAGRSNELHLRAAAYLHKADADVCETAEQLLLTCASGESWVWESLCEAARAALVEGRREEAVAFLRRALREPVERDHRARILAELDHARAEITKRVDVICAPLSSPSLEIHCLGGFRLLRGGRCVDSSAMRPRVRSLLQLLSLHACRPVHREFLLDALWPGVETQAGIRNLQVTVSQLRAFLESESPHGDRRQRLRRDGESYRLALLPGDRCDVREFESAVQAWKNARGTDGSAAIVKPLRMARAWYGGDLLPEAGPTEWVVGDRLRLRALASAALAALAEAELGLGRADAAADAARSSLEIDEYQDASWRVLIAAYRRVGSHAAAERARREYEKVLRGLEV